MKLASFARNSRFVRVTVRILDSRFISRGDDAIREANPASPSGRRRHDGAAVGVTSRSLGTMVQRRIAIGIAAHAEMEAPPPVAWAPTASLQSGRYDIPVGCLSVPSLDRRLVDVGAPAKGQ